MTQAQKAINTNSDLIVPPGMLSSPQIAYYVKKYHIIRDFVGKGLGPASYHMRIGDSVLTWIDGEKIEFELGPEEDLNRNIKKTLELRPNSLTFVTTIETFDLPKDIIARFNLKSKWVHEGVLLGTGPIVDPELNGKLLIPLHNFSSQNVSLNYGDEFISVEFTKTLNPDQFLPAPYEDCKYADNKSTGYNFYKYRNRIGGKTVESSVLSTLGRHGKIIETYEKRLTMFTWVGIGTFIAIFVGIVALVITTWSLIHSSFSTSRDAEALVKQYKDQNIDFRAFALKNDVLNQQQEITRLKQRLEYVGKSMPHYYSPTDIEEIKNQVNMLYKKVANLTLQQKK